MKVLKFGGVSVGSAQNIKRVKEIVFSQNTDTIVVVSALHEITDKILKTAHTASTGNASYHDDLQFIKTKHYDLIKELFKDDTSIKSVVDELLNELEHKAGEIIRDSSIEHKNKAALVESLLTQLIDSVKKTV